MFSFLFIYFWSGLFSCEDLKRSLNLKRSWPDIQVSVSACRTRSCDFLLDVCRTEPSQRENSSSLQTEEGFIYPACLLPHCNALHSAVLCSSFILLSLVHCVVIFHRNHTWFLLLIAHRLLDCDWLPSGI